MICNSRKSTGWVFRAAVILSLFITTACTAQTKKEDEIDIAYQKCIATDTSTANIDACAFVAYAKWNKQMDEAYNRLMKKLKKEADKAALKQSQDAWIAYRDATFKSYDMMFNLPGCKWCLVRHDDRISVVRARALQLRNYAESFEKK